MNIENLEELKEALYRKGFGTKLNAELEANIKEGKPEFILEDFQKIKDDEMGYRIHFRRDQDPEKDKVYLNTIQAGLFKNAEAPGEIREHSFPANQLITASEAYRMLKHGDLVAVNKTLFNKEGQQYNTWLSLNINAGKDEYNNYPVNSYHQNYYKQKPFVVIDALKELPVPVKELGSARYLENIEKSLKKANIVPVTILLDGKETPANLVVNPMAGRIDLYDQHLKLMENIGQVEGLKEPQKTGETVTQEQGDLKKKPWPDQKVNWTKPQQSKGRSL